MEWFSYHYCIIIIFLNDVFICPCIAIKSPKKINIATIGKQKSFENENNLYPVSVTSLFNLNGQHLYDVQTVM